MAIKKQTFKIIGMHCSSCAMTIDGDLEDYVQGVRMAKTSYARGETEVEYDEERGTEEAIVAQIEKTGYHAKLAGK
jgi:copper chaperone CopZ